MVGGWESYLESGEFSGLIQGNLGESLWKNRPVRDLVVERLPVSLELGFIGLITAILASIPIGVFSAIRQDTMGDYIGRTF